MFGSLNKKLYLCNRNEKEISYGKVRFAHRQ